MKHRVYSDMKQIATLHNRHKVAVKKVTADEALPIELRPMLCSATCSEECEHKNYFGIWTWIPAREVELWHTIRDYLEREVLEVLDTASFY
jgi:hypothetical protein